MPEQAPPPQTPFLFYRYKVKEILEIENPTLSHSELFQLCAKRWVELTLEVRGLYEKRLADENKEWERHDTERTKKAADKIQKKKKRKEEKRKRRERKEEAAQAKMKQHIQSPQIDKPSQQQLQQLKEQMIKEYLQQKKVQVNYPNQNKEDNGSNLNLKKQLPQQQQQQEIIIKRGINNQCPIEIEDDDDDDKMLQEMCSSTQNRNNEGNNLQPLAESKPAQQQVEINGEENDCPIQIEEEGGGSNLKQPMSHGGKIDISNDDHSKDNIPEAENKLFSLAEPCVISQKKYNDEEQQSLKKTKCGGGRLKFRATNKTKLATAQTTTTSDDPDGGDDPPLPFPVIQDILSFQYKVKRLAKLSKTDREPLLDSAMVSCFSIMKQYIEENNCTINNERHPLEKEEGDPPTKKKIVLDRIMSTPKTTVWSWKTTTTTERDGSTSEVRRQPSRQSMRLSPQFEEEKEGPSFKTEDRTEKNSRNLAKDSSKMKIEASNRFSSNNNKKKKYSSTDFNDSNKQQDVLKSTKQSSTKNNDKKKYTRPKIVGDKSEDPPVKQQQMDESKLLIKEQANFKGEFPEILVRTVKDPVVSAVDIEEPAAAEIRKTPSLPKCLDNKIVDWYIIDLMKNGKSISEDIVILPTLFYHSLENYKKSQVPVDIVRSAIKNLLFLHDASSIDELKIFLMPICREEEQHWIFIEGDTGNQTLTFYDSLQWRTNHSVVMDVVKNGLMKLSICGNEKKWKYKKGHFPQQQQINDDENDNSGLFMLKGIECRAQRKDANFKRRDIEKIRNELSSKFREIS